MSTLFFSLPTKERVPLNFCLGTMVTGRLHFGCHSIKSSGGVQQGGPLLFSLTVLELLDDVGFTPDLNLQIWYLDDGTIVGLRSAVSSLLDRLLVKGPSYGLLLNLQKCEVFWLSGDPLRFPSSQMVSKECRISQVELSC